MMTAPQITRFARILRHVLVSTSSAFHNSEQKHILYEKKILNSCKI